MPPNSDRPLVTRKQALQGFKTATQKAAQPVTHFALWLIQWAPVIPDVRSEKFVAALLRGAVRDIRINVQRSYLEFSNYNSFAAYLQEVENRTPSRREYLSRRND